jgi:hypothetical protein
MSALLLQGSRVKSGRFNIGTLRVVLRQIEMLNAVAQYGKR